MQIKDLVAVCDALDVIRIGCHTYGELECTMGSEELKPYYNKTIKRISQFDAREYTTMTYMSPKGYEVIIEDDTNDLVDLCRCLDRVDVWNKYKKDTHILYATIGHSGFEFQFDYDDRVLLSVKEPGMENKNKVKIENLISEYDVILNAVERIESSEVIETMNNKCQAIFVTTDYGDAKFIFDLDGKLIGVGE